MSAYTSDVEMLSRIGASRDCIPSSLKALAHLGSKGKYPGNISSELKKWLGYPPYAAPVAVAANVFVLKPKCRLPGVQEVNIPLLLHHIMFNHMFMNSRDDFNERMFGQRVGDFGTVLETFWKGVVSRRDPRNLTSPFASSN